MIDVLVKRKHALLLLLFSTCFAKADAGELSFTASSGGDDFAPEFAFDGDENSRWTSHRFQGQPHWLMIDFGQPVKASSVMINWEAAFAKEYQIQSSLEGQSWTVLADIKDGKGGKTELTLEGCTNRYYRLFCTKPGPHSSFSVWEFQLQGENIEALLAAHIQTIAQEKQRAREKIRAAFDAQGIRQLVFAERRSHPDGHWYANIGYYAPSTEKKLYVPKSRLCLLDLATSKVTALIDDKEGTVRDPVVHYDAEKILFSYRKGGTENFHLYEINVDGTNLRQLTDGRYDDIEPTYLPDGDIMFVSTRAQRWVNCWLTQVAILYRCDGNGRNIQQISANIEHDNTPWVLPDGRVLYQRWEYIDRSQVKYHHLWTSNPDGSNHMVYFGNMHPGGLFIDAKPIPDSNEIILINSPGHGKRDHEGFVAIVSSRKGPDAKEEMKNITALGYRDPWAFTTDLFMASTKQKIVLLNRNGMEYVLHESKEMIHEARPVMKRQRERIIPSRINPAKKTGQLILTDVYNGRNMGGVKRGEIKNLLVMESLPKPINFTGGMAPMSHNGTFTIARVLGTVPVEADGSANFELPANRPIILAALNEKNQAVKRMQSFLSVMPGETISCIGCHENRVKAPPSPHTGALLATKRPVSKITPVSGVPDIFDFPRDIQPILNQHCVSCHNPDKRGGGVLLSGERGPISLHSFHQLTVHKQFKDGRNEARSNFAPYERWDAASPLMDKLSGSHHKVKASKQQIEIVRHWINAGAYYPGTYAALGTGMIGGYEQNRIQRNDLVFPEVKAMAPVIQKRCSKCHNTPENRLPVAASDESQGPTWKPQRNVRFARHILYNLTRPEKSILLLAPLGKAAGGYAGGEKLVTETHPVIFKDTTDPDYQTILKGIQKTKKQLQTIGSFELPGFKPRGAYVREMKRYGILPVDFDLNTDSIDVYDTDRRYFESQWYYPPGTPRPKLHDNPYPYPGIENDGDKPEAFWTEIPSCTSPTLVRPSPRTL